MRAARVALSIAVHDLRCELRRPLMLGSVLSFCASSLVALHLSLAGSGSVAPKVAAGSLWVVLIFGALLAVGRSLAVEREEGTWDALLLAPVDRTGLYAGKVASTFTLGLVLHAVLIPLYAVVFAAPTSAIGALQLAAAVLLADAGFAVVGVLVGAVSLHARGRELLGAAMFLPLALPVVIVAVTLTLHAYGAAVGGSARLLGFLALYDLTFAAIGLGTFPELAVD